MIKFIGKTFPETWCVGQSEIETINNIKNQIEKKFPNENNIIINTTWISVGNNTKEFALTKYFAKKFTHGNLFLLAIVDPAPPPQIVKEIIDLFPNCNVFKIGNFDGNYQYHWMALLCFDFFQKYNDEEILLKDLKYKFMSYNRKPHPHRFTLYKMMHENNLLNFGITTMGKDVDNLNKSHDVFFKSLNEEYKHNNNWFETGLADYGMPHDLFTLGKIDLWQNHFLNIVNETLPNDTWNNPKQDVHISEKTVKPLIGLRPFLINGDPETYKLLRKYGFKTFHNYFPVTNIENPNSLHEKIIEVLLWLKNQSDEKIYEIYSEMLPDLIHNRNRWFEFAKEQKLRLNNIFD